MSNDTHIQRTASIERPLAQIRVLFILVSLFLILATLIVYWQVLNHDFVHYDDNVYVTENEHIQAGLSWEGLIWAFTTTYANFWHPLTWLSYMLDYQIYGLKPGGYHLTNLVFHLANTLLLLIVLKRMTGALWRSAFVAALFALHPLHVESVAWVSERKDVLSAFFWILTMGSYVFYVECPRPGRYLLVLLSFTLGIMAKPMLVTLPFVLLLLDYWPFDRFQFEQTNNLTGYLANGQQRSAALRLVWEKIPFFVIAGAASIVAFLAQPSGDAIAYYLDKLPVSLRIANTLVSYASYIGKMIWPHHLALPYPHPEAVPLWKAAAAGLFLLAVSAMVARGAQRHPYLVVGWLWYLGTLVPVSGLVQVGTHAMADRYTYVPLLGLFILIAWGAAELVTGLRYRKVVFAASAGGVLAALMIGTYWQVHHWHNSITLFQHTLEVTTGNWVAHNNLGKALAEQENLEKAIGHYSEALQINPDCALVRENLGLALARKGELDEAIKQFSHALRIVPNYAKAHYNLGVALASGGKHEKAIHHFSQAVKLDPNYAKAHFNLGAELANQGSLETAIDHFSEALRITPDFPGAKHYIKRALEAIQKRKSVSHSSSGQ